MTKIRNNTFKMLTSIALVMIMSFSMILPGLAEEFKEWSSGTGKDNPAKAVITKILKVPVGTTMPLTPAGESFKFEFTKLGMVVNSGTTTILENSDLVKSKMPSLGPITLAFEAADLVNARIYNIANAQGDVYAHYVAKQTGDILASINEANNWWDHGAGIYKYRLEETSETITLKANEKMSFSTAWYDIEVWVETDEDGTLFAKHIVAWIVEDHEDEYYEGDEGKVDPKPGEVGKNIEFLSQLIFTNKYWKTDGGGGFDVENASLRIAKTTTGLGAQPDKRFVFNITVYQPEIIDDPQEYRAFVVDNYGIVTDLTDIYSGTAPGGLITVKSGETLTVNLKDGDKVIFNDLHVGATVEVEEERDDNYVQKYRRTFSTPTSDPFEATGPVSDSSWSAWGFPRNPGDLGPHFLPEGKNVNIVQYTNTRQNATPTGLDVDDLPYIVMIGLAVVGLIGFAIVKARKKTEFDV